VVRFWEDLWVGNASLAIQYWELYCIVNEQNKLVVDLWDGVNLKCTFHRCVDRRLFLQWEELVNLVATIDFPDKDDALIWQHHSIGLYSSQTLYSIINFRGVVHVYVPSVWKLTVPPRVQFLLWLLSKNKLLTRDNIEKRRTLDDNTCVFCSEPESARHILYECVVAKRA
jgi:hypothetical protein